MIPAGWQWRLVAMVKAVMRSCFQFRPRQITLLDYNYVEIQKILKE